MINPATAFTLILIIISFISYGSTSSIVSFHEKTALSFPMSSGQKSCYMFPEIPPGRYHLRFTVSDEYVGSFELSVDGTVVFSHPGVHSDFIFFSSDGEADVCFYSIGTTILVLIDPPMIHTRVSLELFQIHPASYAADLTGYDSSILVNKARLSCGARRFGKEADVFGRAWQSDTNTNTVGIKPLTTFRNVINTGASPNYFPEKLYKSAVTLAGKGNLEYKLAVDANLDYLVWLHFAEIDASVNDKGKRVFDVVINYVNVTRIDLFKQVGGFAAYDHHYVAKNLALDSLAIKLEPVIGSPLICGIEIYAIVPAKKLMTVLEQAVAMQALRESLGVPERMGWKGDPCAPTSWDAWVGITCQLNDDDSALVIYEIDLANQGLKGYISDKIPLLTDLVSLNLSSNSLGGTIPVGLGQHSLKKLDLSGNLITGSIPNSLSSSNLQLVILNGNKLEEQVPQELWIRIYNYIDSFGPYKHLVIGSFIYAAIHLIYLVMLLLDEIFFNPFVPLAVT